MHEGILSRYKAYLPITPNTPLITLGEGNTPLIKAERLGEMVGCEKLYFKLEGCNPTGSFKDRGMVMAMAKAIEAGSKAVICASTGNTSASAAAFAARFGLKAVVVIPKGNIALGKLAQALIYGAKVIAIEGNFDEALGIVRELSEKHPITLVNSVNPFRLEGQKSGAFEIVDSLGDAPDYLCIPVGNAGNISAYWRGFKEYASAGKAKQLPRMMGFQAEGSAPIVRNEVVKDPQTLATAIKIGNPASWNLAVAARDESKGTIGSVSDEEIVEAYKLLAASEGIFCEPASAASVAGLLKLSRSGHDFAGKTAVCVLTGNGLKDPDTAVKFAGTFVDLPANLRSVEKALGW